MKWNKISMRWWNIAACLCLAAYMTIALTSCAAKQPKRSQPKKPTYSIKNVE